MGNSLCVLRLDLTGEQRESYPNSMTMRFIIAVCIGTFIALVFIGAIETFIGLVLIGAFFLFTKDKKVNIGWTALHVAAVKGHKGWHP